MSDKNRFDFIDSLRGLAIAGVMIAHAGSLVKFIGQPRELTNIAGLGVQLFFVISAFTIFYSLSRTQKETNQLRNFFIKRLFRIFPVYWIGIIIYTIIYGLSTRGWQNAPELWHYPMHFFLVNVLYPTTSSSLVPGGWSISCEVLFYLLVPILYKYLSTVTRLVVFLIIFIFVYPIINRYLAIHLSPYIFPRIEQGLIDNFWYRWIPNQLACFAFGMLLFKLIIHREYFKLLSNKTFNGVVTFIVIISIFLVRNHLNLVVPKHYFYSFLFMVLALLLSFVPWRIIVNTFTIFLGRISFSCYLIHFIILKECAKVIERNMSQLYSNQYLFFITMVGVVFTITPPLAYIGYRFVEQPAIVLAKKVISKFDSKH